MNNNNACNSPTQWQELGPTSFPSSESSSAGIGRLEFIKLHPSYGENNNTTIYAGGKPGLWKSIDNGDNWSNMNTD